jgi:hypothetical protein
MPAVNPRITITLKPQTHAALQRMSALAGNSMSSIVGELLEQSQPVFDRMVRLLEAAAKIKDSAQDEKDRIAKSLEDAQQNLERQLGLSLDWMDERSAPILQAAEKLDRRAGRAEPDAPRRARAARPAKRATPISNRGVTPRENPETVVEVKAKRRVSAPSSPTGVKGAKPRKARA